MKRETIDTIKELSAFNRARSLSHAGRGIKMFLKTTPNAWIQLTILAIGIVFGFYLGISYIEWILFSLASGAVLTAEAFNTAIEIDINLTSPGYHPYARDTKDVAAGAVLITSLMAFVVGILIFGHYIF